MNKLTKPQTAMLESLLDEPRYVSRFDRTAVILRRLKLARLRGDTGLEITEEGKAHLEFIGAKK